MLKVASVKITMPKRALVSLVTINSKRDMYLSLYNFIGKIHKKQIINNYFTASDTIKIELKPYQEKDSEETFLQTANQQSLRQALS